MHAAEKGSGREMTVLKKKVGIFSLKGKTTSKGKPVPFTTGTERRKKK